MKRAHLRPVNPDRKARLNAVAFGRQAELCRQLPCCVCGFPAPSDPDHVRTRGAGGKDRDTVPLCRGCHGLRHDHGFHGPFVRHGTARDALGGYVGAREMPLMPGELAHRFFQHVAQGLRAVFALRDDEWRDCHGFCGIQEGGGFEGPVCMTCMCCRGCSPCLEFPGGRCPECGL